MSTINREYFARKLCSLYDNFNDPTFDTEKFSADVMAAFLRFGSDTPDNRTCTEIIEFSSGPSTAVPNVTEYGFKVKTKEIFVGRVLNELEAIPVPDEIEQRFPDMTQQEWEAVMRIATMVVQAFSPTKR